MGRNRRRFVDVEEAGGRSKGYVYFAQRPEGGSVKIGHSQDPVRRVKDIADASKIKLVIIAFFHGTIQDEQALHKKFVLIETCSRFHCKAGGNTEWFIPDDEFEETVKMYGGGLIGRIEPDHYNNEERFKIWRVNYVDAYRHMKWFENNDIDIVYGTWFKKREDWTDEEKYAWVKLKAAKKIHYENIDKASKLAQFRYWSTPGNVRRSR